MSMNTNNQGPADSGKKQPKTLSLKLNIVLSTLYQILTVITPLITAPYISRILGDDRVGIYSYTAANQMLFAMFAALGTGAYGLREISRRRKDKADYSKTFWEIELMTVMTTAVVLLAWGVWIYLHPEDRIYYLILTISIVAVLFDISWFYMGLEQFKYTVSQNTIFKLLCVVAIFIFVKTKDDLPIYIAIMSSTALLSNVSMWIYLPKFLGPFSGKLRFGKHFRETLIYFIPNVATSVYTILDKTLIDSITGNNAQNGYYEQATKIMNILKAVTFASLNSVFGSRISYLFEEKKYDEIRDKIELSISYVIFMGVGMGFGLSAVSQYFVPAFFSEEFAGVTPILYIFSPMILVIGISNTIGSQYYTPGGYRKKSATFIIIGAVVNLILNLFLIRRFQAIGAAIASVVAEVIILVLYMIFCDGYFTIGKLWKHLWRNLIAGGTMFAACFFVGRLVARFVGTSTVPQLVVVVVAQVVVGAVLYIGLLLLMRDPFLRGTAMKAVTDKLKGKLGRR